MNRKHKITELRLIISNMQNQLKTLEKRNNQGKKKDRQSPCHVSNSRSPSHHYRSGHSPRVLGEKSNNINSKWRERKESTQKSIEKYKSISESVDSQYYTYIEGRKTPPRNKELFKAMVKVDTSYYQPILDRKADKQNHFEAKELTTQRRRDNQQRRKRMKIFDIQSHLNKDNQSDRIELSSPNKFLIENPLSNENLKFFGDKGIVSKGKGHISCRKNRSLIFGGESRTQAHNSCSKRHFGSYFVDHFSSCMM